MDDLPPLPEDFEWDLKYGKLNYMKLRLRKHTKIFGVPITITKGKSFIYIDERTEIQLRIEANMLSTLVR